jgi:hypothetical protein
MELDVTACPPTATEVVVIVRVLALDDDDMRVGFMDGVE